MDSTVACDSFRGGKPNQLPAQPNTGEAGGNLAGTKNPAVQRRFTS